MGPGVVVVAVNVMVGGGMQGIVPLVSLTGDVTHPLVINQISPLNAEWIMTALRLSLENADLQTVV